MTAAIFKDYADEWEKLPWNEFQKDLFRLQHRIYEASKKGNKSSIKKLQNLLLASKCSKYLAVRYVLQLSFKKNFIGKKAITFVTPEYYFLLVESLKTIKLQTKQETLCFNNLRIVNKNLYLALIGLKKESIQCLLKYAIEPIYQSYISENLYHNEYIDLSWNIKKNLFHELRFNTSTNIRNVLITNFTDCFTKADYKKIISLIILPNFAKKLLFTTLKKCISERKYINLQSSDQSTELIRPLLRAIILHGIEEINNNRIIFVGDGNPPNALKYDNYVIFMMNDFESSMILCEKIESFLAARGLNIELMKKEFSSFKKGFSFLDWHFLLTDKKNKVISYPSKISVKKLVDKIKLTFKNSKYKIIKRLEIIKRIYYNWCLYHRYCDMSKVSSSLWSIKNWSYKYLKKNTNMPKEERSYYIQMLFSKTKYFITKYSTN